MAVFWPAEPPRPMPPGRSGTSLLFADRENHRRPGRRVDHLVLGSGREMTYLYANGSGLLTNITASTGDKMSFKHQGPFVTNNTWTGVVTGRVGVELNGLFLVKKQMVNDGPAVDHAYDRDGLLTQVGLLTLSRDSMSGLLSRTSIGGITNEWSQEAQ